MPLVYNELHRLAHRYMAGEQPGQTLQTTALVHEVYLRLVDANDIDWQNRAHFYGLCARLMRRILIDFARSRNYQKRGGHFPHIELEEAATVFCGCGLGTLGGRRRSQERGGRIAFLRRSYGGGDDHRCITPPRICRMVSATLFCKKLAQSLLDEVESLSYDRSLSRFFMSPLRRAVDPEPPVRVHNPHYYFSR
jgi:hypothetical protein